MPKTSVVMNSPGASIERSTCDSAAKLTIASQPSIAPATASASQMSASTSENRSSSAAVEVLEPAGVGHLVEHDDLVVGIVLEVVVDEVGADEPGAAGDEELHFAFCSGASELARSAR